MHKKYIGFSSNKFHQDKKNMVGRQKLEGRRKNSKG